MVVETGVKEKFATSAIRDRRREYKVLDVHVIAVASEGWVGDWAAYIGAVEGKNHEKEWQAVLSDGTKLDKDFAEVLFPEFATSLEYRE